MVINLDRDTARLDHMRRQCDAANTTFTRFAAIDGACVPDALRDYFDPHQTQLTPGEIGCYASHLEICRLVESGRVPAPLLVLEDDVAFSPDVPDLLRRLLANLPDRWDIVRLSYPTKRATVRISELSSSHVLIRYSHVPTTTGAYLLSRSGARKFSAHRRRTLPVDHDLRRVWAWGLDTYGVEPAPIRNDCFGASSIDALSPGLRCSTARSNRIRRSRFFETVSRHRRGMVDFGVMRWLALESVNVAGRLLPAAKRRALFSWANVALVAAASPRLPSASAHSRAISSRSSSSARAL